MLGLGVGAIVTPPIAQRLIASFGWRSAYAIFGAAVLAVSIPIVGLFLKSRPEDIGLLPDGQANPRREPSVGVEEGINGGAARTTRTFWLIAAAFSLAGGAAQACVIHLVPMLGDRGINAEKGSAGQLGARHRICRWKSSRWVSSGSLLRALRRHFSIRRHGFRTGAALVRIGRIGRICGSVAGWLGDGRRR